MSLIQGLVISHMLSQASQDELLKGVFVAPIVLNEVLSRFVLINRGTVSLSFVDC
jgi:hypothetical protein